MKRAPRGTFLILFAALAAAGAGFAGYGLGQSQATTAREAAAGERGARQEAVSRAERVAFEHARRRGTREGLEAGHGAGARAGRRSGVRSGRKRGDQLAADAAAAVQAAAEKAAAQPAIPPGLTYTDELPHGEPGYVLPEDQRTLACVGLDADTGECIGD